MTDNPEKLPDFDCPKKLVESAGQNYDTALAGQQSLLDRAAQRKGTWGGWFDRFNQDHRRAHRALGNIGKGEQPPAFAAQKLLDTQIDKGRVKLNEYTTAEKEASISEQDYGLVRHMRELKEAEAAKQDYGLVRHMRELKANVAVTQSSVS